VDQYTKCDLVEVATLYVNVLDNTISNEPTSYKHCVIDYLETSHFQHFWGVLVNFWPIILFSYSHTTPPLFFYNIPLFLNNYSISVSDKNSLRIAWFF
jgi:hypothetical protein